MFNRAGAKARMTVDLTKRVASGSFRSIGFMLSPIDFMRIPIAAMTREAIAKAVGGTVQNVGNCSLDNVFVVLAPPLRLMFVRPDYSGYRRAAEKIIGEIGRTVECDHVLARSAASKLRYRYVLMVRVAARVNRSHARFESAVIVRTDNPDVAFASMRILDKCLGRPALARMASDPARRLPYDPEVPAHFGLTIKQLGQLGHALGLDGSMT